MKLTEQKVLKYFSDLSRVEVRHYIPIKRKKIVYTFRIQNLTPPHESVTLSKRYRVGEKAELLERYLPNIVLDEPRYIKKPFKKPLIASIENQQLVTHDWSFKVGYCFREALGLIYSQRKKSKKTTHSEWMQTPILSFKRGDVFHHNSQHTLLQVDDGLRCGHDGPEFFWGNITVTRYDSPNGKSGWKAISRHTGSQLDLLMVLIFGLDHLDQMEAILIQNRKES